jgi:protein-disulfide isomerase
VPKQKKRITPKGAPPDAGKSAFALGILFLAVCIVASIALSLNHLAGVGLPGCGEGSPCGELAASRWGALRIGGFAWPTAFFGAAYFLSLLFVWISQRGRLQSGIRNIVRLGALGSLGFLALMVAKRSVCGYCVATHLGNFAFLILNEIRPVVSGSAARTLRRAAYAFLGVSFVLLGADWIVRARAGEKAERDLAASTKELIERTRGTSADEANADRSAKSSSPATTSDGKTSPEGTTPAGQQTGPAGGSEAGRQEKPEAKPATERPSAPESAPANKPTLSSVFTGRYRIGPETAAIRIVMYTDYQCRDCYNIEQQLARIYETRRDVSISIKQFPFDSSCNPFISKTMHPNACAAAYAAEAAGRLWGADAFWKMHRWLFSQRGVFTSSQQIETAVRTLGYDPAGFTQVMMSPEVRAAIRSDAEEGKNLGLFFTPMIFINGVELRGWSAPDALTRAVEGLAATNPRPAPPTVDHPPLALEKYIEDWREQPRITLPPDPVARVKGASSPRVDIVIWGDYQEQGTVWADSIVKVFSAGRSDVRYTYRHFPVNSDCNPKSPDRRHLNACRMALAAEAAAALGGSDAYWKMHVWLMEHRTDFSEEALRGAFRAIGLDEAAAAAAMGKPETMANVTEDIDASTRLPVLRYGMPPGLFSIPTIFVNQRYVPRWDLDGHAVLMDVLEAAAREGK